MTSTDAQRDLIMTPQILTQRINSLQTKCQHARGALAVLEPQRDKVVADLVTLRSNMALWRQTGMLLSHLSEYARDSMRLRIEQIVTAALQAVFPEPLSFQVILRQVGGQPVADWEVVSVYGDTTVSNTPEDARGGGITDVVSLALRIALLECLELDGPLLMDEPGKMISREYLPAVAEFLKSYARETGRQILLVTHHEALAEVADLGLRVSKKDGKSEVKAA